MRPLVPENSVILCMQSLVPENSVTLCLQSLVPENSVTLCLQSLVPLHLVILCKQLFSLEIDEEGYQSKSSLKAVSTYFRTDDELERKV
jgi:hypothetical protein